MGRTATGNSRSKRIPVRRRAHGRCSAAFPQIAAVAKQPIGFRCKAWVVRCTKPIRLITSCGRKMEEFKHHHEPDSTIRQPSPTSSLGAALQGTEEPLRGTIELMLLARSVIAAPLPPALGCLVPSRPFPRPPQFRQQFTCRATRVHSSSATRRTTTH